MLIPEFEKIQYVMKNSVKYLGDHDEDFKNVNEKMINYNKEHNIKHFLIPIIFNCM